MAEGMEFDMAVLGAGPGGYVAAIRGAQLGLKVVLIDRRAALGGTCLNIGCIPSKALLDSSEFYDQVKNNAGGLGVRVPEVSPDFPAMMERKRKIVSKLTGGIGQLMKLNGVEVVTGTGTLSGPKEITVRLEGGTERLVTASHIVLAMGSVPKSLPFLPVDGKTVITSTEALELEEIPGRLLVVGAGAIGLELGSVYARLGSEVHVVEVMDQILPGWDREIAAALSRDLSRQGLQLHLGAKILGAEVKDGKAVLAAADSGGGELSFTADRVLVAVGRMPCRDGLDAGAVRIELEDKTGRILTDERFMTSVPGVYAIGDLIRGPMLAHKAEDEGVAVAEIIAGKPGHVNYGTIPGVVYTWPEAAMVGRTEEELEREGRAYRKGVFPFRVNGRAMAMGESAGFVKVLSDRHYDTLLGVHITGPRASDLIAEAVTVMEFGGSAEDIARTVHAHPTLSEALKEAALGADGRMIHAKN